MWIRLLTLVALGFGLWVSFGPEKEPEPEPNVITEYQMELLNKAESVEDTVFDAAERHRQEMEEQGL